jgi:hypothetical protein
MMNWYFWAIGIMTGVIIWRLLRTVHGRIRKTTRKEAQQAAKALIEKYGNEPWWNGLAIRRSKLGFYCEIRVLPGVQRDMVVINEGKVLVTMRETTGRAVACC